jgi:hypothetical protein
MLEYMGAWDRYQQVQFWRIHLMTLIWFIFTIVLFVLEPLFLHRRFNQMATENSDKAFSLLHRMHKILFGLELGHRLCDRRRCTWFAFDLTDALPSNETKRTAVHKIKELTTLPGR